MGKKDLTDMLGGGGGRTKQKYRCKADGCQVTPMGVNPYLKKGTENRVQAFIKSTSGSLKYCTHSLAEMRPSCRSWK